MEGLRGRDGASIPESASSKVRRFRFDLDIPTVIREAFFLVLYSIISFVSDVLLFIFVFFIDLALSPTMMLLLLLLL